MKKRAGIGLWLFGGLAVGMLLAQEAAQGEIVYAEGQDFVLVRDGERAIYPVDDPDVMGLGVREGDLIQTGPRTFLEIQLLPRGTILKLAENSSFQFKGLSADGSTVSLSLVYGRIRSKVAKLTQDDSFVIRSGSTVAGVRGTDFGFDSILQASGSTGTALPAVRVYCFSGEVAVVPVTTSDRIAVDAPVITVQKNQMVSVDLSLDVPLVDRQPLDAETVRYWTSNEFKGEPRVPAPETALIAAPALLPPVATPTVDEKDVVLATPPVLQPDFAPYATALRSKNTAIGAAILFSCIGLGLQSTSFLAASTGAADLAHTLLISGTVPIGLGIGALISALVIHPSAP